MISKAKKSFSDSTLNRRQILKYSLYGGLAGAAGGLAFWGYKKLHLRKSYNVVLIVLDTARADRFSFLGYHRKTSPHLDALAAESVVYTQAFSTCCWTLPSHASLFTGLFPSTAGATSETNQLPDFNKTLAEVLSRARYHTAGFSCNPWISEERGFTKGFDEFHEMWRPKNRSGTKKRGKNEWATIEKVTRWLSSRSNSKKPFFMFVNLNAAHMPYKPPEPFCSSFLRGKYGLEKDNPVSRISGMWDYLAGELKLTERELEIMSDLYDGEIAFSDYCVGTITEQLKTQNILDDTLVIVTSDHGENLGDHQLIDHLLSMYDTTLHIPLLIRYPQLFNAGTKFDGLVSLVDIAPTILDVCDINEKLVSHSQQASLANPNRAPLEFVFAENERPNNGLKTMKKKYPDFDRTKMDYPMRAIRTDKHKFIWSVGYEKKLYNLSIDPHEVNNIADKKTYIRDKHLAMLVKWEDQLPNPKDTSFMVGKDPESLEALRSLGYVE
ncbi:MAG: sulfatase-like hydrolase/transferase [Planctomycetota bacterium]|jgi:arylsulfatase A-like enzyme